MTEELDDAPYSRSEVTSLGDAFPTRGPTCPTCRTHVPQFLDLDASARHRVLALEFKGQMALAIAELRGATGCSERWAKIWVGHRGGPPWPIDTRPTLCPFCGQPLRTARAKQCRHCKRDWHTEPATRLGP
jgi:hypothetical protein